MTTGLTIHVLAHDDASALALLDILRAGMGASDQLSEAGYAVSRDDGSAVCEVGDFSETQRQRRQRNRKG